MTTGKERLRTVLAFCLMVVMIAGSLFIGAHKAWAGKRTELMDDYYEPMLEILTLRAETAHNLLTVAGRYSTGLEKEIAQLNSDLEQMENGKLTLPARTAAGERFITDAGALLQALQKNSSVQADQRDWMYASQMLPQALEQCAVKLPQEAYNAAAESFNEGLHTFSGFLARLTGVDYVERYQAPESTDIEVITR